MTKEEILRNQIEAQYGSVLHFAEEVGIPQSTIRNIFSRGLDGVGVGTAIKICRSLHLDIDRLMAGEFETRPNAQKEKAWAEYASAPTQALDEDDLIILEYFHALPPDQKASLLSFLQSVSGKNPLE